MCGITGWVDFDRDLRTERTTIEAMTATMTPRGPDAGGVWCSEHAALGHRRLAVIDLPCGEQPMSADGVVLTFSGEIYNFTELRQELTSYGHSFRTRSDTEVLLHSYLRWGRDCVLHLNGMFAFGLWDGRRQELLLARDRLGVKPLYYAVRPDGVLFGSEPKAILANPEFRAEIDDEGLAELFSQIGTHTPGHGVYRGLAELRPGTIAVVGRGGMRTSVYWRLESVPHTDDLAATASKVRDLLTDIVARQTVADVPLCSLLSGGLDSSVVSALAADSLRRRDRAKLATFSVDFAGSADAFQPDQLRPSHDEPFARAAAEFIGSRHSTVVLSASDLVDAQWEPLAAHDLPTMGDMWISMYLLSREIRQQSTVALSGEAADEVFGGYPWYHVPALLAALPFLLDRKDRLSMANGLEVRVPFCDHRLVEYVFNVPWALKEAGGIEKGLLRMAATGLLPDDLLQRRKSIYPGAGDPAYERAVHAQLRALLATPDTPLFDLVSREKLASAYASDRSLPAAMTILPSPMTPAAFLLDVNRWLSQSGVAIR